MAEDQSDVVSRVEQSLQAEVIDVLRRSMPALHGLERQAAYERVMNDPILLHACFRLLRRQPDLFSQVIVDDQGKPVAGDETPLRCGRSLSEIKAMVLRAVARRHFRRKLGGPKVKPVGPRRKSSFLRGLGEALGLLSPPPVHLRRVPGRGDRLYQAMRGYLRFDWQSRLISQYAALTPEQVHRIGDVLLVVREPQELRSLTNEKELRVLAERRKPLLLDNASRLLASGGDTIAGDMLWKVVEQMNLERLFPGKGADEMRKIIAQLAGTSKEVITLLMPVLGHDIRLFASFLFIAFARLGESGYRASFMTGGNAGWLSKRIIERLAGINPLPPPDYEEILEAFERVLTPGGIRPRSKA